MTSLKESTMHRLINPCLIENSYYVILTAIVVSGFLPLSLSSAFSEKRISDPLVSGAKARCGHRANREKLKRHAARNRSLFTRPGSRERVAEIRERAAGKSGRK